MEFILEKEKTPQFYSEAQTEQKYAIGEVQMLIFIWSKT